MNRLGRIVWLVLVTLTLCSFPEVPALATSGNTYHKAKVLSVRSGSLAIKILDGPNQRAEVNAGTIGLNSYADLTQPTYHPGDTVVVYENDTPGNPATYSVVDKYRLTSLWWWLAILVMLASLFAGWRGLGSLLGLGVSAGVVAGYIIPQALSGHNILLTSLIGTLAIAALAVYLAHGFSKRTSLALISTYVTLALAVLLSTLAVHAAGLNGIATEDIAYLHQQLPGLDIQGALLGGLLIGMLGVLDDVTIGQATTVQELKAANDQLHWPELYRRALRVGREHISSLINTLILAYLGSSFLFVLFVAATSNQPLWVVINSELIMEEVVRSLVGGVALILAVPIATFITAYFLTDHATQKTTP